MNINGRSFVLSSFLLAFLLATCLFLPNRTSAKTVTSNPIFSWQNKLVSEEPSVVEPRPEVAHGGGKVGIVWDDNRTGNYEMYFALLDNKGNKIGENLKVTNDTGSSRDPVISWNGESFGIFWFDNPSGFGSGIYFAQISDEGTLSIPPTRINPASSVGDHPSAVWNQRADEYGLVWRDSRNEGAYFARISRDGSVIKETPVALMATVRPLIATSGKEYALTWTEWYTCGTSCPEVSLARLNKKGDLIGEIKQITFTGGNVPLSIDWNGKGYGLLVGKGNTALFMSLSPSGDILQQETDLGNISASNAKLVWGNNRYGVTWTDGRWVTSEYPLNGEVAFQTFDRSGNSLSEVERVSNGTGPSWNSSTPIVIGNRFALAWVENLNQGDQAIYFAQGR